MLSFHFIASSAAVQMKVIIYFVAFLRPVLPIGICDMLAAFPGTVRGWGCGQPLALHGHTDEVWLAQSPHILLSQAPFIQLLSHSFPWSQSRYQENAIASAAAV